MPTNTHLKEEYKIISRHTIADVWLHSVSGHHSLHAAMPFDPGDIMINFNAATIQNYATYLTVQTGEEMHIMLSPAFLQYTNHSCDPNVFFDTAAMQLVCIKPVKVEDELCFFYPSAEWEMARPFVCNCGSGDCLQLINGAAHLSETTLSRYRLTDFILQQLKLHR